jgi:hypothetical protein
MQVDKLAGLAQAVEELAEILLHRWSPESLRAVVDGLRLSYLDV